MDKEAYKAWQKTMKKHFLSAETNGYSCSNCGAACSANNWDYHVMQPKRGVLCFYSIVKRKYGNDSIEVGLRGTKLNGAFKHQIAQPVKVLSGIGVKFGYDIGVKQEDKTKPGKEVIVRVSYIENEDEVVISRQESQNSGYDACEWFSKHGKFGSRPEVNQEQIVDNQGSIGDAGIKHCKQDEDEAGISRVLPDEDEIQNEAESSNDVPTASDESAISEDVTDARSTYMRNNEFNNQTCVEKSSSGVVRENEIPAAQSDIDAKKEATSISNSSSIGDSDSDLLDVSFQVCNVVIDNQEEGLDEVGMPDLYIAEEDDAEHDEHYSSSAESGYEEAQESEMQSITDVEEDGEDIDSPDFFWKRKPIPDRVDDEEKIYFCVACIMNKGTAKVKNEMLNICRDWEIENDQK